MEQDLEEMPVGLYLDEVVAGYGLEEIRNEIGGVIWFISLLTRVDALVLLSLVSMENILWAYPPQFGSCARAAQSAR